MKSFIPVCVILTIFCFQSVAEEKPDALLLFRQGQYEEAVRVCLNELEEFPKNMESYTVMGWSLLSLGKYQEALTESKKALLIAPYDYRIIEIVGEALYYLGENREALWYFEQYAAIFPTGDMIDDVYYFMGEIFIRLGEYNNADIAFSTALYFDNNNAFWWSRLGYAGEMAGDYDRAKEAYENALMLNVDLEEAKNGLESLKKKTSSG